MLNSYDKQRSVFFDRSPSSNTHWNLKEYTTPEEEREARKESLSLIINMFGIFGFDEGLAGHLSVRDPVDENCFWVNPIARNFSSITKLDLSLVNGNGDIINGGQPINKSAFAIHSAIHQTRSSIDAVVHAHTRYGKAWSSLGRHLDPINQDACVFYEDHAIHNSYSGVVNNKSDSTEIAETLKDNKALILQNHGLLTVGETIEEAAWWFILMERSCEIQILAESVSNPISLSQNVARHTRDQIGTPYSGWLSMQPLLENVKKQFE